MVRITTGAVVWAIFRFRQLELLYVPTSPMSISYLEQLLEGKTEAAEVCTDSSLGSCNSVL